MLLFLARRGAHLHGALHLTVSLLTDYLSLFFFNDTATTEIYTLSLHDALPICPARCRTAPARRGPRPPCSGRRPRSEEHTSELQSHLNLVCRLLLEKKNIVICNGDQRDCTAGDGH